MKDDAIDLEIITNIQFLLLKISRHDILCFSSFFDFFLVLGDSEKQHNNFN
jgi:hypothetical protein